MQAQEEFYAHLRAVVIETLAPAIALGWATKCANGMTIDPAIQICAKYYNEMYHNVYKERQADQVIIVNAMKRIQLAHPVTIDYVVSKLAELTVMAAIRLDLRDFVGRDIPAQKLYVVLSADIDAILEKLKPQILPTLVGTLSLEVYDPDTGVTVTTNTL